MMHVILPAWWYAKVFSQAFHQTYHQIVLPAWWYAKAFSKVHW